MRRPKRSGARSPVDFGFAPTGVERRRPEPMGSSHALLIERKKVGLSTYLFLSIMQEMGLEPTRYCYHWHLKPARLPFHHSCKHCYDTILYLKSKEKNIPIDHLTLTVLYLFHRKNTWRSLLWVTLLFLS